MVRPIEINIITNKSANTIPNNIINIIRIKELSMIKYIKTKTSNITAKTRQNINNSINNLFPMLTVITL